jgi:hypothetical protein
MALRIFLMEFLSPSYLLGIPFEYIQLHINPFKYLLGILFEYIQLHIKHHFVSQYGLKGKSEHKLLHGQPKLPHGNLFLMEVFVMEINRNYLLGE